MEGQVSGLNLRQCQPEQGARNGTHYATDRGINPVSSNDAARNGTHQATEGNNGRDMPALVDDGVMAAATAADAVSNRMARKENCGRAISPIIVSAGRLVPSRTGPLPA